MPILIRPQTLLAIARSAALRAPAGPITDADWQDAITSSALTLTDTCQVVQYDGGDMVIELDPGVQAHIQLTFSQEASEWLQWEVLSSLDNSTYDTVNYLGGNLAANGSISAIVTGVRYFKVCGFLIDSDGTPGEDDTTSTLTVRVSAETEA